MSWIDTVKQGISVLSNPSQSSVLAAATAGGFSAEVNNLEKQASVDLSTFGSYLPKPFQSAVDNFLKPTQNTLAGLSTGGGSEAAGTIFGLSYLQALMIGLAGFLVFLIVVVKAVK